MFQSIFSRLSSVFGGKSSTPPEYHLVEVVRIAPNRFKVSSLKLSNPVVLIHGRRSNLFLVLKEGNSQSLFVRGSNNYGELGIGERRKEVNDLEEVFKITDSEIKFVKSGGRHSILVVRKEGQDEIYSCGYNNYSQCGIKVFHKPGWYDNYDSDTTTENKEYVNSWSKGEWPPKKYINKRRKRNIMKSTKNSSSQLSSQSISARQTDVQFDIELISQPQEPNLFQSTQDVDTTDLDQFISNSNIALGSLDEVVTSQNSNITSKEIDVSSPIRRHSLRRSSSNGIDQLDESGKASQSVGTDTNVESSSQRSRSNSVLSSDSEEESLEDWRIKLIECGACHTVIVTESNRIFVRGYNEMGMCGLGNTEHAFEWEELISSNLQGEEIRHIATQCFSTFFLTATNNIYVCGYRMHGRGSARMDCNLVPTRISYPFPGPITHLEAGEDHVLVVTEDSNLYACGTNRHFECGFDNNHNRHEFEKVNSDILNSIDTIKKITCGVNNSLLISTDGKLRAFGEFFSKLDDDEYLLIDDGYFHDATILNDRFIFIRSTVPDLNHIRDDWSVIQSSIHHNKVEQSVEAFIPTPADFQRTSNFQEHKKSPRKRKFESVHNEEAQVHLKRIRQE